MWFMRAGTASGGTLYVLAKATPSTISSIVTGTGQVSSSDQADVETEVSGTITNVLVNLGEPLEANQVIAYLDSADASRTVSNAELSLENAKIAYEKASKDLADQSSDSNVSDAKLAYDNGYSALSGVMVDLPDMIEDMNNIFYSIDHSPYFADSSVRTYGGDKAITYKYEAGRTFDSFKNGYEKLFDTYRALTGDDADALVSVVTQAKGLVDELHSATLETYNTIDYVKSRMPADDVPAQVSIDKNTLSGDISSLNNHLNSLSKALTDIEDSKSSQSQATLDLKSAQIKVSEAEDALQTAREDWANHTIRSPFAGTVAVLPVKKGDKVSNGAKIATLITEQKFAEISLNEVDAAKVKIGQKASLTLDAIDGLGVQGVITETDLIGTVSQGVVSYKVKIAFDSDDERIKPGMTINASIVTESKDNVLAVPLSAVKTFGGKSYLEAPNEAVTLSNRNATGVALSAPLKRLPVETGVSNDEVIEIVSGLNEGDVYVSRTVSTSSTSATSGAVRTTQTSLFGTGARNSNLGGAVRTFSR